MHGKQDFPRLSNVPAGSEWLSPNHNRQCLARGCSFYESLNGCGMWKHSFGIPSWYSKLIKKSNLLCLQQWGKIGESSSRHVPPFAITARESQWEMRKYRLSPFKKKLHHCYQSPLFTFDFSSWMRLKRSNKQRELSSSLLSNVLFWNNHVAVALAEFFFLSLVLSLGSLTFCFCLAKARIGTSHLISTNLKSLSELCSSGNSLWRKSFEIRKVGFYCCSSGLVQWVIVV